jgi:hypothetical protein
MILTGYADINAAMDAKGPEVVRPLLVRVEHFSLCAID